MNAMVAAKEHAIKNSEPVIVHAHCVRIGNHSNSDKHEWYRDDKEIAETFFEEFKRIHRISVPLKIKA